MKFLDSGDLNKTLNYFYSSDIGIRGDRKEGIENEEILQRMERAGIAKKQ
jgi:hypothetical protein